MKIFILLIGGTFAIAPQVLPQSAPASLSPAVASAADAAPASAPVTAPKNDASAIAKEINPAAGSVPASVAPVEQPCKKEQGDCITVALDVMSIIGSPQIPEGVTYHKGSSEDNSKASSMLFALLATHDDEALESMVRDVLVCGPGLWLEMHDALYGKLNDPSKMLVMLSGPPARKGEGRGLRTAADRKTFLRTLRKRFSGKIAWIRRAKPKELSYFWLTIAFDINEPIFVADIDGHILLANFSKDKDGVHLDWLDEVVDPSRFPKQ